MASTLGLVGGSLLALIAILSTATFSEGMGLDDDEDEASCTWDGTPTESPPSVSYLRYYKEGFHAPARIAVDGSSNVYTTDPGTGSILVMDPHGQLISSWKGFDLPLSVAVDDAGRIYVGEQGLGQVSVFDAEHTLLFQLGQGPAEFLLPNDIAIDPTDGEVFVCDSSAHEIKIYDGSGTFLRSFGGQGNAAGKFDFPVGIYLNDEGEVFVADQNNNRVQVLDQDGTFLTCFGKSEAFGRIQGITGDAEGRLYVTDAFQGYIQVFDDQGIFLTTLSSFGTKPGQVQTPMGIAIDMNNRLFVASTNNARLEVFGLDDFVDPIQAIKAIIDVKPDTLNGSSRRRFITAFIELEGFSIEEVDLTTVSANGIAAELWPGFIGDFDGDGIADLVVKFNGPALLGTLSEDPASIQVTGKLFDGTPFSGTDTVHFIPKQDGERWGNATRSSGEHKGTRGESK